MKTKIDTKSEVIANGNNYDFLPAKAFFTLRESCDLKGLNYKTACNRKYLQPNNGIPDGWLGGRKVFSRQTIFNWLYKTDADIKNNDIA